MKSYKSQRNLWAFTGACFLLSVLLNLFDGRGFGILGSVIITLAILSFIRAYNAHKKITVR